MKNSYKISIGIVISILLFSLYSVNTLQDESPEQKRERILNELSLAIYEARDQGHYNCCIEPPCRMCYLGQWLWEDGYCLCDQMIIENEIEKVCPECVGVFEEGCEISALARKRSEDAPS